MASSIPSARFAPPPLVPPTEAPLGLLAGLSGTWEGKGFNLIARPDFRDSANLYLQLNQTTERLRFEPVGSAIPNRGFKQHDINLFGLTYLNQITNAAPGPAGGAALHIESGFWVTQPATEFPPESPPESADSSAQLVFRLATIPHGTAIVAQGFAEKFTGNPTLTEGGSQYQFSRFPSFNSTPFQVPPTLKKCVFSAVGSSQKLTAQAQGFKPFEPYDLSVPCGPNVPRTPFNTDPPEDPLPANINGVAMQDIVNDPILLLQQEVKGLADQGYEFEGVALNIATMTPLTFFKNPNSFLNKANQDNSPDDSVLVSVPQFGGDIGNIKFLIGESSVDKDGSHKKENAQPAVVYATFWLETVTHKERGNSFMQLQYAQMVLMNFPIFKFEGTNLGWPHITVSTLRKSFG